MIANFNFKQAFVKSGSKPTNEASPIININSTFNSFRLNKKAMQLIGVQPGVEGHDRVVMYDMGAQASDINSRFFISKSFTMKGVDIGAKVASNGSFNYSGVYGCMLANDMDVLSINAQGLIDKGLVYPKDADSNSQYIATKVGYAKVAVLGDGEEQEVPSDDGTGRVLYTISDLALNDHASRAAGESDEDDDIDDIDEVNE